MKVYHKKGENGKMIPCMTFEGEEVRFINRLPDLFEGFPDSDGEYSRLIILYRDLADKLLSQNNKLNA